MTTTGTTAMSTSGVRRRQLTGNRLGVAGLHQKARRALTLAGMLATVLLSGCSDTGSSAASTTASPAPAGETAQVTTAVTQTAPSGDYASAWGPSVGTAVPMLAANDQAGAAQNLASLTGEKGLLLVFSRSADW